MTERAALLIPGTPLLLSGVDASEPQPVKDVRAHIRRALASSQQWTVPLPLASVPPLLSLGGLGISVGAQVRDAEPVPTATGWLTSGIIDPSDVVRGEDLVAAVRTVRSVGGEGLQHALDVPPGVASAVLIALEAGQRVRLLAVGDRTAALTPEAAGPLLIPVDFSAAAHPDGPLAPRAGAEEFDARVEAALTTFLDRDELSVLHRAASDHAAWTGALASINVAHLRGEALAAVEPHHVRYRVFSLAPVESTTRNGHADDCVRHRMAHP